jgi:ATP-dependent RNA helicase RhlE
LQKFPADLSFFSQNHGFSIYIMPFKALQIIDPILKSLEEEGYEIPTPIQKQAIPIVLRGKDILGCAQTGTGKTAAFAIPILQLLSQGEHDHRHKTIRTLIVTPTRELAIQIGDSFKNYGRHTKLRHTVIFGGVNQSSQTNALKNGVDILVATPGRLLDLMNQGFVSLKNIEIFVLDEADRMLDMGFIHDVKKLIAALPKKRQSLFFSATMPPEIVSLAGTILHHPERVDITPESTTAETVKQFIYFVDKGNKNQLLLHVLNNKEISSCLVFTRTKYGADKAAKFLVKSGIKAEAIHGDKAQNARQRALNNFKTGHTRILVATDIAARGIDVDKLEYVINYEVPNIAETYVHRIGRTGRAGASGTAFSFCDAEEKAYLKDIEKLIRQKIPVISDHPFPLTGVVEEKKKEPARTSKSSKGSSSSGRKWHRR